MNDAIEIDITQLPHGNGLALPLPATDLAAGMDLVAAVTETVTLAPGERATVPSGIAIALPAGFEAQIRPRSGLAARHGVTLLNSPGTVDADYRGEIGVVLINLGEEDFVIERGLRIAQMVVAPVCSVAWRPVEVLDETKRGDGGFGSTGTKAADAGG